MSGQSEETLHKILQQLQTQVVQQTRSASQTRAQIQGKERETKIIELTSREISSIPKERDDVKLFRSVGKAFVLESRPTVDKMLADRKKETSTDLANLNKKLKALDKDIAQSQTALKEIFHQRQE